MSIENAGRALQNRIVATTALAWHLTMVTVGPTSKNFLRSRHYERDVGFWNAAYRSWCDSKLVKKYRILTFASILVFTSIGTADISDERTSPQFNLVPHAEALLNRACNLKSDLNCVNHAVGESCGAVGICIPKGKRDIFGMYPCVCDD